MTKVKKSTGSGGAPSLDILAARLQIVEDELTLEEKEVAPDDGRPSFMADPNLNCRLKLVKNIVEPGVDEGVMFYDRFKLKKDKHGDWTFAKYSKLGNLISVRYGAEWFDSDDEFEEKDFEDFEFIAQVEPKTDSKGSPLTGSTINWKSMRKASSEEKVAEEATQAEAEEEDDFESIPF